MNNNLARSAADKVFGRMRTLVDNVAVALDGPPPTPRDKLVENWTLIQEFYSPQRSDDNRKLRITDTTIPYHLESILKILGLEMQQTPTGAKELLPLEFGPCVEFLLQYHVLSDLVDFADADQPRGMRKYVLRFFGLLVGAIPLGLLPESAVRLPLVAIMRQSLHVIQTSPMTPINPLRRQETSASSVSDMSYRLGTAYHSVQNDQTSVILAHDLLDLIVTLFGRLREHSDMAYLFFDWSEDSGWNSSVRGSDLAVASLRAAASGSRQSARGHELFIVHIVVEYLLAPGVTGQLAREALVLVVQVLLAPPERARYVGFLLDQSRIVEMLVEHMAYLHAQIPVYRPMARSPDARLFSNAYAGGRLLQPLHRRIQGLGRDCPLNSASIMHLQALLSSDCVLRSAVHQDRRESAILASASRLVLEHVDAFFFCWELLDEIAVVAADEARVVEAVQTQLTSGLLRTHIEPALLSTMQSRSQAITTVSYLTDLIGVTHSTRVLDALFAVLLGADVVPERPPMVKTSAAPVDYSALLSPDDCELLASIEDDSLRAEAAQLLIPPGAEVSLLPSLPAIDPPDPCPLRSLLVGWMTVADDDRSHLALNTLRLFDAILSTLNQFAYTSLVLRNFADEGGPALGLGVSVAADQELVRAVVDRFLDAAPGSIANAMPEVVVSAAMRIESNGDEPTLAPLSPDSLRLLPSRSNFQAMCSQIMRDNHGCDEYVDDCLARARFTRQYISQCWQKNPSSFVGEDMLEGFYPGAFLSSLITQFSVAVKRHMAYNLMLTSMINKLACVGNPALTAYLFLANGATASSTHLLYDSLVAASADAYVKSERVPRFAARLARQRYEGVETAIRVGAAHPMSNRPPKQKTGKHADDKPFPRLPDIPVPVRKPMVSEMDVDTQHSATRDNGSREDVARAVRFLGTPIKRFVHGYIVLDEFAKEMAATALALHTVELDHQLMKEPVAVDDEPAEEYADLLEYFEPGEPAYRRAVVLQKSVCGRGDPVIDLGSTVASLSPVESPGAAQ
ncbi:hypothetical protein GGI20_003298 [Coemansia sp. BCRC 34301]|nr:hypothetical protein GGI20_003298 [Coemansia sp. BCRC 34301]